MKRLLAISLTATITISGLFLTAGCGKKDLRNDPNTLYIDIFNGGYGYKWLDAIAKKYTEKTGQSVTVCETTEDATFLTNLQTGTNNADVVFARYPYWEQVYKSNVSGYSSSIVELTDIYKANIPGENITLQDKLDDRVEKYLNLKGTYDENNNVIEEDKYYHLSWAIGNMGFIKNNNVWKDNWNVPKTTDEMFSTLEVIKSDIANKSTTIKAPILDSIADSYFGVYRLWSVQYEGRENIENFSMGFDSNGRQYQSTMYLYDGFEKGLEILQNLVNYDKKYLSSDSLTKDFTTAQNLFLQGNAALMPNGAWIEREMSANFDADSIDIEFIKMPVISSLVQKMKAEKLSGSEKINNDADLSAVIDYADGNSTTLPNGLTESDGAYIRVKEARNLTMSLSNSHVAFIPAFSGKIEKAKEFLQYFYSDEAIKTYSVESGGYHLPVKYDFDNDADIQKATSSFLKKSNKLISDSVFYVDDVRSRLFALTGLLYESNDMKKPWVLMSYPNSGDRKTAQYIFNQNYTNVNTKWRTSLNLAGIDPDDYL